MAVTAVDKFPNLGLNPQDPAHKAFAITKSDTDELPFCTRAIYVGGTGDINVILKDDTAAVVLSAIPVGTMLPISARQVKSTSTTATLLIGLY